MGQIDSFKRVLGVAGQTTSGKAGIEVKEEIEVQEKKHQDFPVQNLSVNIHVDLGYFRTEIFARQSFQAADQTQTVFFRETVCQQNALD